MHDSLATALVSIVLAIIGLAAFSVLVSPNAKTSEVFGAASKGLATDIAAAVAPVSGGMGSLTMPSLGNGL
jgi:hypothetical protein